MTRGTAHEIAGNLDDIIATHAGPNSAGKYCGFITRGEVGRYRIIISTGPFFNTPESADDAMATVERALALGAQVLECQSEQSEKQQRGEEERQRGRPGGEPTQCRRAQDPFGSLGSAAPRAQALDCRARTRHHIPQDLSQ